ncbi:MAG: valine--tRNA ligase [Calditrichia bacterium]
MNEKLLKPYEPKETEDRIYKLWEESGYFNPDNLPGKRKESFTIVIPPPNITGVLHMGHALNATIQDILIRQKRMRGFKTLWVPGTDHAGIATQNAVEKMLKKKGMTRHDLGREKFVEEVWKWKKEYGSKILDQLKKIGASCDWSRTRFTMDENYTEAVKQAFLHYYDKKLIYQGERVINWCKRCQTSLSDLEIEYEEKDGKLYYIKYPFLKAGLPLGSRTSKFITVATTRPETMLGDTAVAVNPKDIRYKNMVGKILILPIVGREIPIIKDADIDKEFGTGAVKVTPAHSIADSGLKDRHDLESVTIINELGKMTGEAGKEFEGLSTKEAREKVVAKLGELKLLEKTEEHSHRISKCYRCDSVIEPRPSVQWFLKMDRLAKTAMDAVKNGEVKFNDKRWEKIYMDWLSNIKDWCISRQIWWGHKIPIEGVDDVMDTWFSSALWPFAVLDWPNKESDDLKEFYPTQVLSTARDIINLWVARMIFSSFEFMKGKPFTDIIIHPTVLTKDGKRMSKSLGTGTDPMELIDKYGADATRFGLIYQMMGGQDMQFNESALSAGKKFANKLWNITRFVLGQISNANLKSKISNLKNQDLTREDKAILEKLERTTKSVTENVDQYKFGQALHTIYDFVWHDFADVYIEYTKSQKSNLKPASPADRSKILLNVLTESLKLLHPFMPFITEEIWSILPLPDAKEKTLLIIEKCPNT